MPNHRDYLDELFIDKLGYEPAFQRLTKPSIDGSENLIELSRDYIAPTGNIAVIVAECKDRLPHFQKALIKEYKRTYPDAHFLFISNKGKVFDLYNYATSKKLRPVTYNEIDRNTKLFKEKIQFFNASAVEGSADLRVQIEKAFETTDKITKKFYDKFKGLHDTLTKAIKGIKDEADRKWYATTLLNRIMFIFFLQKNYVLQGDTDYLLSKYDQVKWKGGNYYKDFLLQLFFKGFAKKDNDPEKKAFTKEYGEVKYLNGGLFYPNKIELKYASLITEKIDGVKVTVPDGTNPEIEISNNSLHEVITFLNGYTWYLDNRPTKDENEINPDVLGYIFEKYINQKELGAYYTKEDITEYISKNTIIPFIFDKLRNNGFTAPDPTPLITNNEDIISIADKFITECHDYKTVKFLYKDILQPLSVLDPAVGSGAFLFAALNILLPVYQATVGRLKTFKGKVKDVWLNTLLGNISGHPEEYYLTKQIILNNLYGVDIVEEGVEICKLRLFLQLASHLADIKSIEPLPDIDFNIYSGNSLVGGLSWKDLLGNYGLKLFTKDGDGFTEEELKKNINDLKEAKKSYKQLQTEEDDERKLKQQKGEVQRLENRINHCIDIGIDNPFHWFVEYAGIFERGGFDIVIGNPPYVEYREVKKDYILNSYRTIECRNLYAFFLERSIGISTKDANIGMIVPVASVCTDKYISLQNLLKSQSQSLHISSYNDRPGKLFEGLEHIRLSIILASKETLTKGIFTTKYNRWFTKDRPELFKTLKYKDTSSVLIDEHLPKVGTNLDISILNKIRTNKPLIHSIDNYGDFPIYYTRKLSGFVQILNFVPEIFDSKNQLREPSELKEFRFSSENKRDVILSVYNSTLFYWYLTVFSDCRNLNKTELVEFNFDYSICKEETRKDLQRLGKIMMKDIQKHSDYREMNFKKFGKMTVQCTIPKFSKPIVDEIDEVLSNHYRLDKRELDFIKNFELPFRIGADEE